MTLLLWLGIGVVLWSHFGYPVFLALLAPLVPRRLRRSGMEPNVTVIIAAHNEERAIARKVVETLALAYPAEKLDVVVAADGCTDATCSIVEGLANPRVRVLDLKERPGKTAAQNIAAAAACGEILVFTDATTELPADAIHGLVSYFIDPTVGCVGAELNYISRGGTAVGVGNVAYWDYEKMIKRLESRVNSLVGVSGCLYAVRARAYRPIDPDVTSDFAIASDIAEQGMITTYAEDVVATEETNERVDHEFRMRVRVIVQSIHALVRKRSMLNPLTHGLFAVQLLSHKVFRYLTPLLLMAIFGINIAVVATGPSPMYVALLAAQAAVYGAGAVQYALLQFGMRWRLFDVPFYFLHGQVSVLWALIAYVRGERATTWIPVR